MLKKGRSRATRSYVLVILSTGLSLGLEAQTPSAQAKGANTITSNKTGGTAASNAYIDAAPFFTAGGDICETINGIISPSSYKTSYPDGAVIDARGILPSQPSGQSTPQLTCSINPFVGVTAPSTIPLPGAGGWPSLSVQAADAQPLSLRSLER